MLLISGLGNIGKEYENTPHNSGFLFVDTLREILTHVPTLQVSQWVDENKLFSSEICKVKRDGETICILQKPLTYMNLSGKAVKQIYEKFNIQKFVLVHDDLDIQLGKYKIQEGKSPKGHNGVLSVENSLNMQDFTRVRIGIENRGGRNIPGEDYVLIKYSKDELLLLNECISESIEELLTSVPLK